MMRRWTHAVLLGLLISVSGACTSSKDSGPGAAAEERSSGGDEDEKPAKAADAGKTAAKEAPAYSGPKVFVNNILVTTAEQSASFLPQQMLGDALAELEEKTRQMKKVPVPILTTYLGLLRIYQQNPSLLETVQKAASGAGGMDDPWFCIEAAYAAMQKHEFMMADFLFAKAKKAAPGNTQVDGAILHASGVRHFLMDERQVGIALLKKATEMSPPHYPSLLTLGFLALRSGDAKGAEQLFDRALAIAYSEDHARIGKAAALRLQGRTAEAVGVLESVWSKKENSKDKRFTWNYVLGIKDTNGKKALSILEKFTDLEGVYPELDAKAADLYGKLMEQQSAQPAAAGGG